MKTIDFSYFIERYNAGEMDDAEKQWFIKELKDNQRLRQEVNLRTRTDEILRKQDLFNLRKKLNTIEKKREEAHPVKKSQRAVNIKYAAAIAGFIIIGSIILLSGKKMSSDEIISRYYKPYEAAAPSRSAETPINNDFSTAVEYYNIHDFRNAAIYFDKVLKTEPGNMHSALLNGISNYEIHNYPAAESSFSKVIDDNNNFYIDHAQWYLAMCYIQTDEKGKAIEQLALIEKSKTIYRKDARKILRSLK